MTHFVTWKIIFIIQECTENPQSFFYKFPVKPISKRIQYLSERTMFVVQYENSNYCHFKIWFLFNRKNTLYLASWECWWCFARAQSWTVGQPVPFCRPPAGKSTHDLDKINVSLPVLYFYRHSSFYNQTGSLWSNYFQSSIVLYFRIVIGQSLEGINQWLTLRATPVLLHERNYDLEFWYTY